MKREESRGLLHWKVSHHHHLISRQLWKIPPLLIARARGRQFLKFLCILMVVEGAIPKALLLMVLIHA
jgi:hypothetical protein